MAAEWIQCEEHIEKVLESQQRWRPSDMQKSAEIAKITKNRNFCKRAGIEEGLVKGKKN